jgi:hypothetical protein
MLLLSQVAHIDLFGNNPCRNKFLKKGMNCYLTRYIKYKGNKVNRMFGRINFYLYAPIEKMNR